MCLFFADCGILDLSILHRCFPLTFKVSAMESKLNQHIVVTQPKDRSLEAYKVWVIEIAERLTKEDIDLQLTPQDWTINWQEYWQEQFNQYS